MIVAGYWLLVATLHMETFHSIDTPHLDYSCWLLVAALFAKTLDDIAIVNKSCNLGSYFALRLTTSPPAALY